MHFNIQELKAKAGKPITLTLKHLGKASVKDTGHNFVIIKPGTNFNDYVKREAKGCYGLLYSQKGSVNCSS